MLSYTVSGLCLKIMNIESVRPYPHKTFNCIDMHYIITISSITYKQCVIKQSTDLFIYLNIFKAN